MNTNSEQSQESGQLARNTERPARRSRSPRPSLESRPGAVRHRSPARPRPSFPKFLGPPRVRPMPSTQITPFRSTEMPHRGRQRERSPPRQQIAPGRIGSTQDGRDHAPSYVAAQDRLIKELKASVESQKTDIQNLTKRVTKIEAKKERGVERDRKIEEQEGLIKTLQEEKGILKQRLDSYAPRPHDDSPLHPSEA